MLLLLCGLAWAGSVQNDFSAGSYGRVQTSFDLHGGRGEGIDVVSHPPRLEEGPYLELDLRWKLHALDDDGTEKANFEVLVTPAFEGDLFHYDGVFAENFALRNLYAKGTFGRFSAWAGSRMYRGDDVYLLDLWPLDNLNTVGGGASFTYGANRRGRIALHVGANRLYGDQWQFEQVPEPLPGGVGSEEVLVLDRQRVITSLRWTHEFPVGDLTLRTRLYGELHTLPPGQRIIDDPTAARIVEDLAPDFGTLVGAQVSLWGWAPQSFAHLWFRYATGLAATGELTIPTTGLDDRKRVAATKSWMVAVSGNHDTKHFGVQAASYLSYFVNADGQRIDFDDRWEWVGVVRPQAYIGRWFAPGIEVSHQLVRPNGANPRTHQFEVAHITKVSVIPALQLGKGAFTRPRLHVVYTASFMNQGARDFFNPEDARVAPGVQHFIGIGAEWWLNSNRVITPD